MSTESHSTEGTAHASRLQHFPVAFFAIVMGLAGLTVAWEKAGAVVGKPLYVDKALATITPIIFLALIVFYTLKWLRYPNDARADLKNPIKLAFLPAISIGLILISLALLHRLPEVAKIVWIIGTSLHLVLTLYVINSWIYHPHYKIQHMTPAWFIPAVGNVLVPLVGVPLGYEQVSWFFFSTGMMFWVILFTIVFYRVLFHDPLPERMIPTLFILIAPPAVGFLAYMRLTQAAFDPFAHFLYYSALFLTLLLLTQIKRFARLQFFLSWWAYSFPLAAITVATFVMYEQTHTSFFLGLGFFFLIALTIVVLMLLYKTLRAMAAGKICVAD